MALYDVYFKPKNPAIILVEANSIEEAIKLVEENWDNEKCEQFLSDNEITDRIYNSLQFYGSELIVEDIEKVEE